MNEKVVIGFSRPKNKIFPLFSWLVRLFQGGTKYSHVYVKWHSSYTNRDIIYEASGTSVRFVGGRLFNERVHITDEFDIEITKETKRKIVQFCVDNAGIPYGCKQILGIALVKLFKLKRNPFRDGKESQVCAEAVGYILREKLGFDIQKDLDTADVKDIYNLVMNINN